MGIHNEYFPFEGLISYLQKSGYEIKEDTRVLLQQKWESLDNHSPSKFKEFKTLLLPLFTQNEVEATRFSLLFDRFFYFPFAGFLDYLQQNGYTIGIDSYLRLQELMNHLDPNTDPLDLKHILCPLFAQNPDEQEKFYYLFDTYFSLFPIVENKSFIEIDNQNNQNTSVNTIKKPTQLPLILTGLLIVFLGTIISFSIWQNIKYTEEISSYSSNYNVGISFLQRQQYIWNDLWDKPQMCDSLNAEIIYTIIPEKKGYKAKIKCKASKEVLRKNWTFQNKSHLGDSFDIRLPKVGTYPVSLNITNALGCSKQVSGTILVVADSQKQPLIAQFSSNISGLQVQFLDSSVSKSFPITSWYWEFGDSKTGRENNPKHTYKAQGRYKVTLTVKNEKEESSIIRYINLEDRAAGRPDNLPELRELPPVMTGTSRPTEIKHHTKDFLKGLLLLFIIGLPVMTFFFLIFRRQKRKYISQADKSIDPPYFWPINIETKTNFYDNALWNKVTTNLRKREEGEKNILDIPLSLQATLEAGGFPTLTYRAGRRPVEYLFFIDRASFKDHQAIFFRQLAEKLSKEDIYIDIYFHNAHFQYFWRSFDERPIYLEELIARHPKHRLVIMGDGNGLVDAYSGELSPNAEPLIAAWKYRALMTCVSPSDWGLREVSISKKFVLLPAKLAAFSILSERFDRRGNSSLQEWITGADDSMPNFDFDISVSELRTYLGEEIFTWLCACATYPELHWDMTIFLGKFLSEELYASKIEKDKYPLLTEENLLKLVRLPFFRRGEIPDKTRMELLDFLEDKLEYKIRTAIIKVLEDNLPPEGTRISDKLKVNLVLQKWQRDKTQSDATTKGEVEGLLERDEIRDYVVLEKLKQPLEIGKMLPEQQRISILTFFRKLLFRNGFPMLGMKSWIIGLASGVLSLVLLIIFITSNPLKTLNFKGENGKKYDLETRQDSINYYSYNGIIHYNDSLYGPSLNDYREITQNLDAFNVRSFYNSGLANYALFKKLLNKSNEIDSASIIESIQDYEKGLALLPQLRFCHVTDSQAFKTPLNASVISQYSGNNLHINYQFVAGNGLKAETYSIGTKSVLPMLAPLTQEARIKSLALSKDGNFLAVGTESFNGMVYDLTSTSSTTLQGHRGAINVIKFSPDANYVATGSSDNTVILWDRFTGQEIHRLIWHKDRVSDLNFSADNNRIITCSSDETAVVWDRELGYPVNILPKQEASLVSAGFLANDRLLFTVSIKGEVVIRKNDRNSDIFSEFNTNIEQVTKAISSPDGSMIAIGGSGGVVKIFDLQGNLLWTQTVPTLINKLLGAGSAIAGENTQISALSFSNDGRKFLVSSNSGSALYSFSAPQFSAKGLLSVKHLTTTDYNGTLLSQNEDFSIADSTLKYYALPYNLGVSYWEALQFEKAYQCFSRIPIDEKSKTAIPILISRGLSAILAGEKSGDKDMFENGVQDLYQVYQLDKEKGFVNMTRENAHKIVKTLDRIITIFPKEQKEINIICTLENAIYDNYCELKKRYDELGAANNDGYLPFCKKDKANKPKWGYLDKNMREIIPAKYAKAGVVKGKQNLGLVEYESPKGMVYGLINMKDQLVYDAVGGMSTSDGLFSARKGGLWGYLDSDFDERIAPQFEDAGVFQSGIAIVKRYNKYGFILKNGKPLTSISYEKAEPFDNRGMAKVVQNNVTFYIDKKGNKLSVVAGGGGSTIPPVSANPATLDVMEGSKSIQIEGMSRFQDEKSKLFGFKDASGKIVVNATYSNAMDFTEGLAGVCREVGTGELKWGFINKSGLEIIQPSFDKVNQPFSNGIAIVQPKGGKQFSINTSGICIKDCPEVKEIPYSPQIQRTPEAADIPNTNVVQQGNGWVLKDKKGGLVINTIFENRPNFFGGVARVKIGGKWGFVFRDGKDIKANYEEVGDFSEGLAAVKLNGLWGYIDLNGTLRIHYQFEEAGAVRFKSATVKLGGKVQTINVDEYISKENSNFVKKVGSGKTKQNP